VVVAAAVARAAVTSGDHACCCGRVSVVAAMVRGACAGGVRVEEGAGRMSDVNEVASREGGAVG
jgi:hypothetical protein